MAYDPNLPATGSPIVSAELRGQFAGLKDLIDAKPSTDDVNTAIATNSAQNVDRMEPMSSGVSDPPTQDEVQQIYNTLNYLIGALHH